MALDDLRGSNRCGPPDWPRVQQWDWELWLPEIPRPWARPRPRGGDAYKGFLTPWTAFHRELGRLAASKKPLVPFSGPLRLEVAFHFPRPKSGANRQAYWKTSTPDLDNLVKGVGDVLQHAEVVEDDRFVVAINAWKIFSETPGVAIYLRREPTPAQHPTGSPNSISRKRPRRPGPAQSSL